MTKRYSQFLQEQKELLPFELDEMSMTEVEEFLRSEGVAFETDGDFIIFENAIDCGEYLMLEGVRRTLRVRGGKIKRGRTAGRAGWRWDTKANRIKRVPPQVLRKKKMKLRKAQRRLRGKRMMILRKSKRSKRIGKRFTRLRKSLRGKR